MPGLASTKEMTIMASENVAVLERAMTPVEVQAAIVEATTGMMVDLILMVGIVVVIVGAIRIITRG
jgi:hypothetical protein